MRTRIINAHTLEPDSGERRQNAWIDIEDGRITDSGVGVPPSDTGAEAEVIDAAGVTVMPGLVDAHVHIIVTSTDTADRENWAPRVHHGTGADCGRRDAAAGVHHRPRCRRR